MEMHLGQKLVDDHVITAAQLEEALDRQRHKGGRLGQNLVALGYINRDDLKNVFRMHPPAPLTVEETGLSLSFIADLIMKQILFMGEFRIVDISERSKLPALIVETALDMLRREKFVEIKGASGYSTMTYIFKITDHGRERALELLELCRYAGPMPVTLSAYQQMVTVQTIKSIVIRDEDVRQAFSPLVINESLLKRFGPAVSSGRAMFIYGPSGNGKTAIAETIGQIIPDDIYVPYAITVGDQIISLYDPVTHEAVAKEKENGTDQRWVLIKRPVVMTGGELTLRMLDLDFNPISKYYEASLQMKANNGVFIADDFGRQQVDPRSFLNRWIVPLERREDFMTLHTGMKFVIPFDLLVVFSTNIEPSELVDEAFLRRIRYKIRIGHPSEAEFELIYHKVCEAYGVEFRKEVFDHLIANYYRKYDVKLNACHPRDFIEHIIDHARYYNKIPQFSREGVQIAWENYFVEG